MSIVRSIVAALLALSLAVTPAVAKAAFAVMDAPAQSSHVAHGKTAAMPDCHRATMQHDAHRSANDTHHKKCPDCDKRGACNADLCQLKCFKVLSTVASADRAHGFSSQRLYPAVLSALEPRSFKPQPPPPRI